MPGRRAAATRRSAPPAEVTGNGSHPDIQPVGKTKWTRLGLYSYPGWGKTTLAASSAELGRTLIIHSSLSLLPSRVMKQKNLDEYQADTWEKMLEIQEYLRLSQHPYLWVWWDCASIDQDVLLDDIWAGTIADKPSRAYKLGSDGKPTGPNLSPSSGLDKGEYGRNMERIQQWVRHMVGCNSFHFGITFHPHEGNHPTNDEGGTLLRPWLQGKNMPEKICGYMSMVAFLEVMEGQKNGEDVKWRRLHTVENARFYAHDRYDAFLPKGYLDNPTMPKIQAAIDKSRGSQTPARGSRGRRGQ